MRRFPVSLRVSLAMVILAACEGETRTPLEMLSAECLRKAVCDETPLNECVQRAGGDDAWSVESGLFWGPVRGRASCVEGATDCDEFWRCLYGSDLSPCDDTEPRCEGNSLRTCFELPDGRLVAGREDCAAAGQRCIEAYRGPVCAHAPCGQEDMPLPCEGDVALWCVGEYDPVAVALDCGDLGKVCVDGFCYDRQSTACGEPTSDFTFVCAGGAVQWCVNGRTSTWECSSVDAEFSCLDDDLDGDCGMPAGRRECEMDSCDGDVAKVCVQGKTVSVDCASFMVARCVERPYGITCAR